MFFSPLLHGGFSKLSEMDIPSWYSFVCACILAIWLSIRIICRALTSSWLSRCFFFFLKYVAYPHILPRIPFFGTATRLQVVLVLGYIITNILLVTIIGVKSRSDIGTRAATMSVINLIPLLLGSSRGLMTEIFGISLRSGVGSHQWIGRTAIAEILLHTLISLNDGQSFKWTRNNTSGVVVSFSLLS